MPLTISSMDKGLISQNFIDLRWLQKELIEREYNGELKTDSIKVWWEILAKWRRENEVCE